MNMLAPKARTNLPFASNFSIGGIMELAQEFEEQRSNTQMLLPSLWSTWTLMAPPSWRPAGSCSQLSCILYGLGAALGSAAAWVLPRSLETAHAPTATPTIKAICVTCLIVLLPCELKRSLGAPRLWPMSAQADWAPSSKRELYRLSGQRGSGCPGCVSTVRRFRPLGLRRGYRRYAGQQGAACGT